MSTSLEAVVVPVLTTADTSSCTISNNNKPRYILKSKENILKPKCSKELRKKLKKYKLRRDGQEDQEVLDVSQILITSLKIKSPNNKDNNVLISDIVEEITPKNYLFKMGRRKQVIRKEHDSDGDVLLTKLKPESKIAGKTSDTTKTDNGSSPTSFPLSVNPNATKNYEVDNNLLFKDNTQTNAFKLMMDSRNKSIGSNSPGKEKVLDQSEIKESIEKKNIKAKRNLLLQKMAEAKGSLKNRVKEELQEEYIKKKMEMRAKRLKEMITETEKPIQKKLSESNVKNKDHSTTKEIKPQEVKFKEKKLKLVSLFEESIKDLPIKVSPEKKIAKEDQEFLQKLSPSIKKKENMLCYFKKIEKDDSDSNPKIENIEDEEDNAVIKVKLIPKAKKKVKKKKLSLSKSILINDSLNQDTSEIDDNKDDLNNKHISSSKNEDIKENFPKDKVVDQNITQSVTDSFKAVDSLRPRRNVKRPAKYIENMQSSSDEELHIFTPKKKKHGNSKNPLHADIKFSQDKLILPIKEKPSSLNKDQKSIVTKNKKASKEPILQKKNVKIAPIFTIKPPLDAAAIEAKQKFLSSGVPEKLKKLVEKQYNKIVGTNCFYSVVHVQQTGNSSTVLQAKLSLNLINTEEDVNDIDVSNDLYKTLLHTKQETFAKPINMTSEKEETHNVLLSIKQQYPRFPVYRTYRLLKDKSRGEFKDCSYLDLDNSIEVINGMIDLNNDSPDRLSWTDKFKPMSSKQIIGNFDTIKDLKKWLVSWTENDVKTKRPNTESDSSDFYQSDADSKDNMRTANNLLILTGPIGSGKTSIVYAVAAELAIKVLEVNASSRRTGKIMLQDLQEATQSHKVNRGKSSQEIQKSQDIVEIYTPIKPKKRGRPKRNIETLQQSKPVTKEVLSQPQSSQESSRHCMSLILIDDADIVFDQDDGFCSAIVQLVQCSKRPVILITSSTTCPHLQRFFQYAKVIQTRPLSPRILGTWLDIMCLTENGTWWPGLGNKLLDYFRGDIRKTIHFLQFNSLKEMKQADKAAQNADNYKANTDDENSNMSWSEHDVIEEKNEVLDLKTKDDVWLYFIKENRNFRHFEYPMRLFHMWWNIPRLLNFTPKYTPKIEINKNENSRNELNKSLGLKEISSVVEVISISDYFRQGKADSDSFMTNVPWLNLECDSVSEQECFEAFDKGQEVMDEICHTLVTGTIADAQHLLETDSIRDLRLPSMSEIRERDKITSRHNNLTTYLNPSSSLDRRALALDYWPACRSISRIERTKTDSNSKRNNRFCHYLKSLNVLCRNESFDNLCYSLCFDREDK